jgi:antitoxin component YwqK of YwqJK toxin-antitoxin module
MQAMNFTRSILLVCTVVLCTSLSAQEIKREYYEDGKIKYEYAVRTVDGKLVAHGTAKWYYNDGSVACEKNFENGMLNGPARWYHKNGELHMMLQYKNGKQDGLEKQYSEDGTLTSEKEWKDGVQDGRSIDYYSTGGKQNTAFPGRPV